MTFNNSFSDKIQLYVYDIQGKLVFSKSKYIENGKINLNVSELRSGLYFLKINNGQGEVTKKLIVHW